MNLNEIAIIHVPLKVMGHDMTHDYGRMPYISITISGEKRVCNSVDRNE